MPASRNTTGETTTQITTAPPATATATSKNPPLAWLLAAGQHAPGSGGLGEHGLDRRGAQLPPVVKAHRGPQSTAAQSDQDQGAFPRPGGRQATDLPIHPQRHPEVDPGRRLDESPPGVQDPLRRPTAISRKLRGVDSPVFPRCFPQHQLRWPGAFLSEGRGCRKATRRTGLLVGLSGADPEVRGQLRDHHPRDA